MCNPPLFSSHMPLLVLSTLAVVQDKECSECSCATNCGINCGMTYISPQYLQLFMAEEFAAVHLAWGAWQ